MFSLTMLGSGSAGTARCSQLITARFLVDGGLSARQLVLRQAQCGVMPEQLDDVTHEHGDHVCGFELLCRN